MTNNLRAIHPGEILRVNYAEPLGLSVRTLAALTRVPFETFEALCAGRAPLDQEIAAGLARIFDTTEEFWLNLQADYDRKFANESAGSETLAEWFTKTNWIRATIQSPELGMHVADVMRQRLQNASKPANPADAPKHYTVYQRIAWASGWEACSGKAQGLPPSAKD